jgi:hypothetical protein
MMGAVSNPITQADIDRFMDTIRKLWMDIISTWMKYYDEF